MTEGHERRREGAPGIGTVYLAPMLNGSGRPRDFARISFKNRISVSVVEQKRWI